MTQKSMLWERAGYIGILDISGIHGGFGMKMVVARATA